MTYDKFYISPYFKYNYNQILNNLFRKTYYYNTYIVNNITCIIIAIFVLILSERK